MQAYLYNGLYEVGIWYACVEVGGAGLGERAMKSVPREGVGGVWCWQEQYIIEMMHIYTLSM